VIFSELSLVKKENEKFNTYIAREDTTYRVGCTP